MVRLIIKGEWDFWNELNMIRGRVNGPWCIGGDWNIARFPSERLGGGKSTKEMRQFSEWINSHSLVDLYLGGASCPWSNNRDNPAMARLYGFLVSTEWLDIYPEVLQLALPKPAFDHCPILLDSECERWGPTPFRFELMWLEEKDFPGLIQGWWEEIKVEGWLVTGSLLNWSCLRTKWRSGSRRTLGK